MTPASRRFLDLASASWSMVRRHPVVTTSLGAAVLVSVAAIPFGIGIIVTPWFVCELLSVQLAILGVRTAPRGAGWVRAGVLILAGAALVALALGLGGLALGPDLATVDHARGPLPPREALTRASQIAAVGVLAAVIIAPFAYAPLLCLESGVSMQEALLRSAYRTIRRGSARHAARFALALALPLAPMVVASVIVGRTFERAATPVGALLALPLVPLLVPLGSGLLVASYVLAPFPARETAAPPRGGAPRLAITACVLAPLLSLALLALTITRPSPPRPGQGPGELLVTRVVDPAGTTVHVPDTTLAVVTEGRWLRVTAGDGSDTGALPAPWRGVIEEVRVRRTGEVYVLEARVGARTWHTAVDRAAVRVDDAVAVRLATRLSPLTLPSLALSLLLSAILLAPALAPFGAPRAPPASVRRAKVLLAVLGVGSTPALAMTLSAALA